MDNSLKEAGKQGWENSRITSRRQGIIRGTVHGVIIAVSFFNPFEWWLKILIFLMLMLTTGAIFSSNKFKGKI